MIDVPGDSGLLSCIQEGAAVSGSREAPDVVAGQGVTDALRSAGRLGADLLAVDWTATPLGPPRGWSQSLTTALSILVSSRFSMWMAWGPELTFFCNDAYRRDTLGTKYPWALGRPASEVWAEIWPDIGPRIDRVTSTRTATWDEALLLFLERSGYVEETYHTFSYSPLTDDDGRVAGMLCVVSEETERVIGERRMRTLRDLGSGLAAARSQDDVLGATRRVLAANPYCLPFTLLYLLDEDGTARPVGATGFTDGSVAPPRDRRLDVPDTDAGWPFGDLDRGSLVVSDLERRLGELPRGAWRTPPGQALVVPLVQQGGDEVYGYLVAGLNRHRVLDEGYRGFVELIARQVAAGVVSARAYEAERRRAEALAELDRAKTTFFTNVSHEFRTPLTLMLGPVEDALNEVSEPLVGQQRHRVEVAHHNAQRLLKLVNTLLDFSRLESGTGTVDVEPVELGGYTAALADTFSAAVIRAGLWLTIDCPPLERPVAVDREMWAKIVLNLLSNALKFTVDGGITVRLREHGDHVVLHVVDTGIGVHPAEQPRLFERFHRVAGAQGRSHEGSGIGLALVAELAALHGGEAAVTSAPGEGSTFTVRLPRRTAPTTAGTDAAAPVDDAARRAQGFLAEALPWLSPGPPADGPARGPADGSAGAQTGTEGGGALAGRPRVLVVDDNADMRRYVAGLLGDSYRVETAADGVQALRAARERPPDLVLTDVMMPQLDGMGLLRALRGDPSTALVPVVMLSARAGPEAATDGLEAGADDYLVKPFSAGELRARVRANLELDRTRRAGEQLERSRMLLDQAQRLAMVGSWEVDLGTGAVTASEEFRRQLGVRDDELRDNGLEGVLARVHPDDQPRFRQALCAALRDGQLTIEARLTAAHGTVRTFRMIGELVRGPDGTPSRLRGSQQDVTEARAAEQALAAAAAAEEAAAREHRIADELQRSLLPRLVAGHDHLEIASYYRAGVAGTQVGGDWFDVIPRGADRTALVIGDVMGRGVRAAAVMGQLRAAVRAYARLDMPASDILELVDALVRDLGDDQIVTCLYAVYDPGEQTLVYANAGHPPPILVTPGQPARRLDGTEGAPLGSGPLTLTEAQTRLPAGSLLALYTDGLIEHRGRDIDVGLDLLTEQLTRSTGSLDAAPGALVTALVPTEPDDDIAVLLARVTDHAALTDETVIVIPPHDVAVRGTRHLVGTALRDWQIPQARAEDVVLVVSELVTNAVVHGRPPVRLRLRKAPARVVVEVYDGATFLPRKLRPTPDDEHGRGLQLVALLADRWGTRLTADGKSVWCVVGTR